MNLNSKHLRIYGDTKQTHPFVRWLVLSLVAMGNLFAGGKPNVLFILVDDLKPALGCYGDPLAKTPHIDSLASRGTRFDLAFCNQAVCAPSRYTLMLGSLSTSTGLYGLGSDLRALHPDAVTLPQHFAKQGYTTESLGKIFHIGHGNLGDPESFSFPHFKEKVIEYRDPASKPEDMLTREEAMFQNVPAPPGGMNQLPRGAAFESPAVEDEAYADGRVAKETHSQTSQRKKTKQALFYRRRIRPASPPVFSAEEILEPLRSGILRARPKSRSTGRLPEGRRKTGWRDPELLPGARQKRPGKDFGGNRPSIDSRILCQCELCRRPDWKGP